jgi:hypothetical protein
MPSQACFLATAPLPRQLLLYWLGIDHVEKIVMPSNGPADPLLLYVHLLTWRGGLPCRYLATDVSSSFQTSCHNMSPYTFPHPVPNFYSSLLITSSKKVKLSPCLTNQALCHEGVWGNGCINPHFLGLGTSWKWVASFMTCSLYPWGKSPRYPLDRRLGGPQNWSGWHGEEKILVSTGTWTPVPL